MCSADMDDEAVENQISDYLCWQVENVDCMENNHIKFDFLGKDSIRYENEVQVHERVYALVKQFCGKDSNGNRESVPLIFYQYHR